MRSLHQLIQTLTSRQWKNLLAYLSRFFGNDEPEIKSIELAKLLRKSKDAMSAKYYSKELYGKENAPALTRLAQLLRNRVLCSLSMELHIEKGEKYDRRHATIRLKQKSLQYFSLFNNTKELELAESLLDEIIKEAREYGHYEILIEHLLCKKWQFALRRNAKEYEGIGKEVERYKMIKEAYELSYDYVAHLKILCEHSGKPDEGKVMAHLEKAIPDLEEKYNRTGAPIILYYLKTLELHRAFTLEDYSTALETINELKRVVLSNKSVYTPQRIGIVYYDHEECLLRMGDYNEALKVATIALNLFPKGHFNYMISKQWEFYALFYSKCFSQAEICAREVLKGISKGGLGEFRSEKFCYLLACALFMQGDYDKIGGVMECSFELKADKDGWEFNRRVLLIMLAIESEEEDLAQKQTDQLRKFVEYNSDSFNYTQRQKEIVKLLTFLAHKGFMFTHAGKKVEQILKKLYQQEKEYRWDPLTSELIPFHKWVASKIRKRSMELAE